MIQNFDFHLHTNNSDGELTTKELVETIKSNKIDFFSITDHDDVKSIKEVKNLKLENLNYIKGIEISSIFNGKYKMHILGYGFDENNEKLLDIVNKLKKARKIRFKELVQDLEKKFGLCIEDKFVKEVVDKVNIPGKPHLAKLMIEYGYVKTVNEAFEKYLEKLSTETSNRIDAKIAIEALKSAGGIAIWAHPKKVEKQYNIDILDILPKLVDLGLDGIEVYNSLHSYNDCEKYKKIAKDNKLLISGGSDFHGALTKPNVKIGVIYNSGENNEINLSDITVLNKLGEENYE